MAVVLMFGGKGVLLALLVGAAWRQQSQHGLQKPPELSAGSASHAQIAMGGPVQPPALVEACCGLAASAENAVVWLPTVCNGLSTLGEPFYCPRGSDTGGDMRTVLYFMSLGNFIMIISASVIGFTLCRLFPKEEKKKKKKRLESI